MKSREYRPARTDGHILSQSQVSSGLQGVQQDVCSLLSCHCSLTEMGGWFPDETSEAQSQFAAGGHKLWKRSCNPGRMDLLTHSQRSRSLPLLQRLEKSRSCQSWRRCSEVIEGVCCVKCKPDFLKCSGQFVQAEEVSPAATDGNPKRAQGSPRRIPDPVAGSPLVGTSGGNSSRRTSIVQPLYFTTTTKQQTTTLSVSSNLHWNCVCIGKFSSGSRTVVTLVSDDYLT